MSGQGQSARWVVENEQTGAWLGVYTRHADDKEAEFGERVPLFYADLRTARSAWRRHCIHQGYLSVGVSLNLRAENMDPGWNHSAMPPVVYRQIMFVNTLFVVRANA